VLSLCCTRASLAWQTQREVDPAGIATESDFLDRLKRDGLAVAPYLNWYAGRWPSISFIGGMCMGNGSQDSEFFYRQPFRYYNQVSDFVMEGGGDVYGIRTTIHRSGPRPPAPAAQRSFLLTLRCDALMRDYHPSYILVNGRRVWDASRHPILGNKILVPFWGDDAADMRIDFVVEQGFTPPSKGLAFRMFFVQYLGDAGCKVDLKGAAQAAGTSPADGMSRFAFGLFPSSWDFWATNGVPVAQIKREWKPNFRPDYPVDDVWLAPFVFDSPARGKYHDFMVTYGGCNVLGTRPDAATLKLAPTARAALASMKDPRATQAVLDAGLEAHWFLGEQGVMAPSDPAAHAARMQQQRQQLDQARQATAHPDRVKAIFEPFSPALSCAHEYERGHDLLVLKNEEDPQYNILMSMARGAGRTFGKPFGFYWEQTHYPHPSADFKLQACLEYFLCGGSWIGAEAENFPAYERDVVPEVGMPFVKAMRFAMVHPARGRVCVPVGIVYGIGDKWIVPYNPLGHFDTFLRCFSYDHATHALTAEPNFTAPHPWTPADRSRWNFNTTGHMAWLYDSLPELRGYDLLDVFFPQYGDACTAHIARLLTGTPFGPVDFVYGERASAEHLRSFGMLAILGHARLTPQLEQKLTDAVRSGVPLLVGAQHFGGSSSSHAKPFGLELTAAPPAPVTGMVSGSAGWLPPGPVPFSGRVYRLQGEGWETVASVNSLPLVVRKSFGKGEVFVYLGQWVHEGGAVLRPLLAALGRSAAPLELSPADDQVEYVPYRKGAGAWVAVFNHGGIAVGCDRLKELRATPPEPLCSTVKGPYRGQLSFNLQRLGLDASATWTAYEVEGIDGPAFDGVVAGTRSFVLREMPCQQADGVVRVDVTVKRRGQYLLAPRGQGDAVFFGKPDLATPLPR
jgi:hypothetical protein